MGWHVYMYAVMHIKMHSAHHEVINGISTHNTLTQSLSLGVAVTALTS